MLFTPSTCPECGSDPKGTVESVMGLALLEKKGPDSYDWEGLTEIWWDSQETLHNPDGLITLQCPEGHEWFATWKEDYGYLY